MIATKKKRKESSEHYDNTIHLSLLFDNGTSLLSDFLEEDLEDLVSDEDYYTSTVKHAETTSKAFSHQHSTEICLIDKGNFLNLNWRLSQHDFENVVNKYSMYLTPLRSKVIIDLLCTRYDNLHRRMVPAL